MSKLVRAISELGGVVVSAIDSTDIVARMEEIHKPSAVVSAALGRMLTASQLMGSTLKSKQDSVTIRIKADGPIGLITVACDGVGNCKGFAENNIVEIPLRNDGK
ncbi:MAG: Hsp33 family molecular chaperone HslO, partial [Oscillospiraceae bacterium]